MDACYCDGPYPEFYHAERRTARKHYRCDECGRAIAISERYEHVRAKWEGDIGSYKTCPRCLALRDYVEAHVPCFCWNHHNMIEEALATADAYAHETVGLQFGALRRKVLIYRGKPLEKKPA